jgi:hypothetical protein
LHEPVRLSVPASWRWSAIVVGLAAATVLTACGGDDGSGGASPAATDYASCLRANGVTLPSGRGFPSGRPSGFPSGRPTGTSNGAPNGGTDGAPPSGRPSGRPGGGFGGLGGSQAPAGVDQATWEKAQKACEGLRASAFPGGGTRGDNGALTAYRNCLSDHGVTVTGSVDNLDASDPKVAEAVKACAPLRPSGMPTASPTPSS